MDNSNPPKGSMLERWKWEEDNYMDNILGLEPQNGPFTTYHPDGQKRVEGNCDNGIPIGKWTYYNEDGSIKKVEEH